jgi:hypothetical protein
MPKIFVREGISADLDLGTVRPGKYELVKTTGRGDARNSKPEPAYILDNLTVSKTRVDHNISIGNAEIINDEQKPEGVKMATSDKIYGAIMVAMNEIGFIGKDKKNPQQGYNFRGIDDVLNSLQPALIKAKLFIVPRIVAMERQERQSKSGGVLIYTTVRGEYDFVSGEDGSKITASTYGEGMDSSDKSTNKAMSAALKYAVIQTFSIPTKEMIDGDADHPEPEKKAPPAPKTESKPPAPPKVQRANKDQIAKLEELYTGTYGEMVADHFAFVITRHRKNDKLSYSEAQDLIDNWQARLDQLDAAEAGEGKAANA